MGRLHRETPVREKGAVYSTCTFYEQLLPMATQQCPGQKGRKVHENFSQQGGNLLQSALQFGGDAAVKRQTEKQIKKLCEERTNNIKTRIKVHVRKRFRGVRKKSVQERNELRLASK